MALEGGVLWPCRYCGGRFADLSEHFPICERKKGKLTPVPASEARRSEVSAAFDRKAYQRVYMREYRRRRRALRGGEAA
jgi:hypothetical protein